MLIYMTAYWGAVTVSIANTILLFWLGFMVLLNAERRSWGVWMIGSSLLAGGAFFVSHTVILVLNPLSLDGAMSVFWGLGLAAVITLPFAWYTAILWYTGFWDDAGSALRRRHRLWFGLNIPVLAGLWLLLLFANPFPTYAQAIRLQISPTPTLLGLPLLVLLYPPAVLLSIGLSIDALLRPGPARRMMGELARQRAKPWLLATSGILLLVGGLVGWVMLRVVTSSVTAYYGEAFTREVIYVANSDLVAATLITLAVICLGQAVARYEVFTGKTMPQQRFMRQWRDALLLAFGFGGVMSAGLLLNVPVIYLVLLMGLIVTLFYALFSRSSSLERTRYIEHLRPFVSSQRLYDHMTQQPPTFDLTTPFSALCRDVLGTNRAFLVPVGSFAPLISEPVAYPARSEPPPLHELPERFTEPGTMYASVEPGAYGGASLAVPLWSERGLIGVFLLGDKRNGGLYTQEEIEIARASGERMIDMLASAEMSRRLMAIQRERLAQSQVIDRRTRRMLHDEVLPSLHAVMLTLPPGSEGVVEQLAGIHRQIADLLHQSAAAPEVAQMGLIPALRKAVEGELGGAFERVEWQVQPEAEAEAERMPVLTAEVLYYAAREAMRNAAVYGRGDLSARALRLRVEMAYRSGLIVVVEDDGVGLGNAHGSRGGSGHGLALHSTLMAVVGGALTVESVPGQFTRVVLALPTEK